jgi:glycosyltransferase involved in cell wall biosynthesis
MRVTHVITRLIVGGAQENTVTSVLGLQRKTDWNIKLISGPAEGPEGSLAPLFAHQPESLIILPQLVRPIHPWKDWVALQRLTQLFREDKPDLVHTHSGKAGFLGRLAAAKAGVPIVVHTIHGPSFGSFQGPIPNILFKAAERYTGRITTHFVSVAQAMSDQYLAAGIGRPEQYTRIFSGFELDPFLSSTNDPACRARWGIDAQDIVVGCIARLFKLKGHDDLLRIAPGLVQRFPRMRFLLVGDGEWRDRLVRQAEAVGVRDRFVFTGLVKPTEMPALAGIMDIVVHLSRREGLPRALSQALAAARPVVAYDCDGAAEICLDQETGFLLRPGDLAGISARLAQLAGDAALRDKLGRKGREYVRERFGTATMVDALHALYLKLERQRLDVAGRPLQA